MKAILDNRLRIPLSQLSDEQLAELQRAFTYDNPQYKRLKAMRGPKARWMPKGVPRYISNWQLGKGEFSVPRGAVEKVEQIVGPLELTDRTTLGEPPNAGCIPPMRLAPRSYQVELVKASVAKRTALIRSPMGSGKTFVAFSIAAELSLPTLVVVPSTKIFKQWVQCAETYLGLERHEVGVLQGSTRRIRPLTIAMQQTLHNCVHDYKNRFGVVIVDESQKIGSKTLSTVVDALPARWRIAVSGDERRADGKEFLIYDLVGPVAKEVSREELIGRGTIVDAAIYVVPTDWRADWYIALKPQRRMRPEVLQRLATELYEDSERNQLALEVLGWCIAEGRTTITLAARREHCAMLNQMSIAKGWNSGLLLGGETDKDEFERTEYELRTGKLKQAVGTYQALGVGFDLPVVSRGIFASPCASKEGRMQFAQFCGRFERPCEGKKDSRVYYLWDQHVHGLWPLKRIARWKPRVYVKQGSQWVPAKQFIKEYEYHEAQREAEEDVFNM